MKFFDFEAVAKQAGISDEDVSKIVEVVRVEFPQDDMMRELHILRACMAIRDGQVTVEEVLRRKAA